MKKEITWVFEGKQFKGFATLENGVIALRDEKGNAFETLEDNQIENGMTLEGIFEDIPEDVTDFSLV